MQPLLQVDGLSKRYGSFALEDVSLKVGAGSIMGFIGRNGAGKSTTLKCLEGAVAPDGGTIAYFGKPFVGNEDEVKLHVGFELGSADFYRNKTVAQIARVTKRFYGSWSDEAYERYSALFNIDPGKRVKDLSQGMRVKFALALALSHKSKLLVLDEPPSGLDPVSREEVLDIFLHLAKERGVGILFSTHITSDLDKCADTVVLIDDGRIIGAGSLASFKDAYRVVSAPAARAAGVHIISTRKVAQGETALVSSQFGIGEPATLDEVMAFQAKKVI